MKQIIITIAAIFCIMANIAAQETKGAKIAFNESTYEFDTIIQNSNGTHEFWFTNEGNEPLLITKAFSSCGCIVPSWPKEPVMPKQKGCIEVKYNTNILGHFQKAVIVKSNDLSNPKAVLRMSGTVIEPPKEKQK